MRKAVYKSIDLFGNETVHIVEGTKQSRPRLFHDYDAFTEKFEVKKTTDDCYTPPAVFDIVLNYVKEKCNISEMKIIRPFYPGGDFECIDYPDNGVVIDNPPFSIISKIARFYIERRIPFFLFAPHLTLFSADIDCTHVVTGAPITYDNGATVSTSFLTNMMGDLKVIGDPELRQRFKLLAERNKVNLPKYVYPDHVLTVSEVTWIIERGIGVSVNKKDAKHCRGLDSQKRHGKVIFGSGFLLAEKAAAEKAAAEKAAAEKAAAEKAAAEKEAVIVWELSEREWKIIRSLSNGM